MSGYWNDSEYGDLHRDYCGETGIDDYGNMRRADVIYSMSRAEEII